MAGPDGSYLRLKACDVIDAINYYILNFEQIMRRSFRRGEQAT